MQEHPSLATRLRGILVSLALVVAFVLGGLEAFEAIAALRKDPARGAETAPRTAVRVIRVRARRFQGTLRGYGRVRSLRRATVAAEVAGVVRDVDHSLEPGGLAQPKRALVVLDDRDLAEALKNATALVAQKRASLASEQATLQFLGQRMAVAERELEISRRRLKTLQELERTSASARDEVDVQRLRTAAVERALLSLKQQDSRARSAIKRVQAELDAALSQERLADVNLRRARIEAPWKGTIESREIQVGDRVAPGTPLFRIVDQEHLEVPLTFAASRYGELRVGAAASLRLSEDGEVIWKGVVARIAPVVDTQERTFKVFLEVRASQAGAALPPGSFVVGGVAGRGYEGVMPLPRTALVGDLVYVVERSHEDPRLGVVHERRPVIERLLPEVALIASGLADGEEVVTTNLEELSEGDRVLLVDDEGTLQAGNGKGR